MLVVLIGLVMRASVGFAQPSSLSFAAHVDYPVGQRPVSLAVGEFDGDGALDIAVANSGSSEVSILLGNGDGTFGDGMSHSFSAEVPSALVEADIDGDTRADLLVASDVDSSVTVLLGNGDGTFIERIRVPVGEAPEGLVAADFDGDGDLDVATADSFGDTVTVLLGDGRGALRRERSYPVGAGPCGIVAADFDGDGRSDLAVSLTVGGEIVRLFGRGDGAFLGRCVGDCSGDGRVTIDELVRGVALALGGDVAPCDAFDASGDGSITVDELVRGVNGALEGCSGNGFQAGDSPGGLLARDFTGDGFQDLAVANEGSEFVSLLHGLGDGFFDTSQDFVVGGPTGGVESADFDGDGTRDLVVAHLDQPAVSVVAGHGDGTFGAAEPFAVSGVPSGGFTCGGVAAGDLNGDGKTDIVSVSETGNDLSVLLNTTSGPAAAAE